MGVTRFSETHNIYHTKGSGIVGLTHAADEQAAYRLACCRLAVEASSTLDQAMAAAPAIKDERQRALLLDKIISTRIKLGHFDQALTVAQSIESEHSRMRALDELANAHIKAGHLAEALQLAPAIKNEYWRSLIVGAVAAEQAKAHQFSDAIATAASIKGSIKGESPTARALASIAVEQARGWIDQGGRAHHRSGRARRRNRTA